LFFLPFVANKDFHSTCRSHCYGMIAIVIHAIAIVTSDVDAWKVSSVR